uniref:Phenoloxidase III n=1 Tax=Pimpla hypochondriaca TaxID=135724 RepID=Q9GVA7_PIMHY|nr:phenoloxidase III [Pimpla hypochondriaca]
MIRLRSLLFSLALIASIAGDETDTSVNEDILALFDPPPRPNAEPSVPFVTEPPVKAEGAVGNASKAGESPPKMSPPKMSSASHTSGTKPIPPKKLTHDIPKELYRALLKFGYDEPFSAFIDTHARLAGRLIDVFMKAPGGQAISQMAERLSKIINRGLLSYALSVAILNRNDMTDIYVDKLSLKSLKKYVVGSQINAAQKAVDEGDPGAPVVIAEKYSTASDTDVEHCLAYFREDIGVNLHHWHWHLVYPYEGSRDLVNKDRRGELFYYMHHQILARYNVERLSNGLNFVERFGNVREPIIEGYFSKLDSQLASRSWPSRPARMLLTDVDRKDSNVTFKIEDLELWAERLYEAIRAGHVKNEAGKPIPLDEKTGINVLGNIIEGSPVLSVNYDYYGSIHNKGHMAIAYCHDPDGRYLEKFGVMGESSTAMRDPIFYRWHTYVDEFFVAYKNTLAPYSDSELNCDGIEVSSIKVISKGYKDNHLKTFWGNFTVDLGKGLDFASKADVGAIFTHLDHRPFEYEIRAANTLPKPKKAVVRIFIAPKVDKDGNVLNLERQRPLMIEMDKFSYSLKPGVNTIVRKSVKSTVTNPFARVSRGLHMEHVPAVETFCGCGWPQYMLVPKGTEKGLPMDLFVMISNDGDHIAERDAITGNKVASTMCGLRNRTYPDARAMGFPFDRPFPRGVTTLRKFLTPNMAMSSITVQFIKKKP